MGSKGGEELQPTDGSLAFAWAGAGAGHSSASTFNRLRMASSTTDPCDDIDNTHNTTDGGPPSSCVAYKCKSPFPRGQRFVLRRLSKGHRQTVHVNARSQILLAAASSPVISALPHISHRSCPPRHDHCYTQHEADTNNRPPLGWGNKGKGKQGALQGQ